MDCSRRISRYIITVNSCICVRSQATPTTKRNATLDHIPFGGVLEPEANRNCFCWSCSQLKWWLHCKGQCTSSCAAPACSQDNHAVQVVVGLMSVPLQHERHAKLYRPHYKRVCPCLCHHCTIMLSHTSFLHTSLSRPEWCHTHMLTPLSIPILLRTILVTENLQHSLHLSNLHVHLSA